MKIRKITAAFFLTAALASPLSVAVPATAASTCTPHKTSVYTDVLVDDDESAAYVRARDTVYWKTCPSGKIYQSRKFWVYPSPARMARLIIRKYFDCSPAIIDAFRVNSGGIAGIDSPTFTVDCSRYGFYRIYNPTDVYFTADRCDSAIFTVIKANHGDPSFRKTLCLP